MSVTEEGALTIEDLRDSEAGNPEEGEGPVEVLGGGSSDGDSSLSAGSSWSDWGNWAVGGVSAAVYGVSSMFWRRGRARSEPMSGEFTRSMPALPGTPVPRRALSQLGYYSVSGSGKSDRVEVYFRRTINDIFQQFCKEELSRICAQRVPIAEVMHAFALDGDAEGVAKLEAVKRDFVACDVKRPGKIICGHDFYSADMIAVGGDYTGYFSSQYAILLGLLPEPLANFLLLASHGQSQEDDIFSSRPIDFNLLAWFTGKLVELGFVFNSSFALNTAADVSEQQDGREIVNFSDDGGMEWKKSFPISQVFYQGTAGSVGNIVVLENTLLVKSGVIYQIEGEHIVVARCELSLSTAGKVVWTREEGLHRVESFDPGMVM